MQHSMIYCHALSGTTAPAGGGVLRRPPRHRPTPLRGAAGVLPGGRHRGPGRSPVRLHRGERAGDGARLPRRRPGLLRAAPSRTRHRPSQAGSPCRGVAVAPGRPFDHRDHPGAGHHGHAAEPHRDLGVAPRRGVRAAAHPACRPAWHPAPRPPTPHPPHRLASPAAAHLLRLRRRAAASARPGRPRPARSGQRRPPARHPRGPRPLQRAQPAGAQSHRPPPRLPRRRRGHRPRPGHLRGPGVAAQGDRAGHLLLPARAPPSRAPAGRPRPRDAAHRAGSRHRVRPGLPRDHALRRRRGPGDPLRAPPQPAHRERVDLLRPRTG
jgi:hypothetical protein